MDVTYTNGAYQIYKFAAPVELNFLEFPENETPAGVGKVTLELYSDSAASRTITFKSIGGLVYKKNTGFPVNVKDDPFATPELRTVGAFPTTLTVSSATNPVIIEVWRYKSATIFLNYVGQFI